MDDHPSATAASSTSSSSDILRRNTDDGSRQQQIYSNKSTLKRKRKRRRSYTIICFVLVLIYGFTSTILIINSRREAADVKKSNTNNSSQNARYNNIRNDNIRDNNNYNNYKFDGESSLLKSSSIINSNSNSNNDNVIIHQHHNFRDDAAELPSSKTATAAATTTKANTTTTTTTIIPSSQNINKSNHNNQKNPTKPSSSASTSTSTFISKKQMKEMMRNNGRGGGEIVAKRRQGGEDAFESLSFESIKNIALGRKNNGRGKEIDEEEVELDDVVVGSRVGRNFTINIYNNRGQVPRLPVIMNKPIPIPSYEQVENWMSTPGNQSAGQFLLDFAILGFAKCGTSTMMFWLGSQREIFVPDYEITNLQKKHTVTLIEHLYGRGKNSTFDPNIRLRGYKSPNDIMDPRPARILGQYFNRTKLIIGIRHPIYMIESFYNHRIQNGLKMPPLDKLTFKNMGGSNGVTLGRASYHSNLLHLGKTPLTKTEMNLMPRATKINMQKNRKNENFPYTPNKVYLYDTAQLSDKNETRHNQVLQDLSNFLGLNEPLVNIIQYSPGKVIKNQTQQAIINSRKVQICDNRYKETRRKLIRIGFKASQWILQYFLSSPDVYISNVDHFIEILKGYTIDPCSIISNLNDSTNNATAVTAAIK